MNMAKINGFYLDTNPAGICSYLKDVEEADLVAKLSETGKVHKGRIDLYWAPDKETPYLTCPIYYTEGNEEGKVLYAWGFNEDHYNNEGLRWPEVLTNDAFVVIDMEEYKKVDKSGFVSSHSLGFGVVWDENGNKKPVDIEKFYYEKVIALI